MTARLANLLQENPQISGEPALVQIAQELNHPNRELVIEGGLSALQELQCYGIVLGVSRSCTSATSKGFTLLSCRNHIC